MDRKLMFLLAGLAPAFGRGQEYVPMTTDGSRWLYHITNQFQVEYLEGYDLAGDTTLNGQDYRIIRQWEPIAGLRDDSGQVWCFPFDPYTISLLDTVPILLYDFGLQAGDSFPIPRFPGTWAHVTSRDSVQLLDGSYRDRLGFAPITAPDFLLSSLTWIEGIGDPEYLLWALWDFWEVGIMPECYGINNVPLYGYCLYLGEEVQEGAIVPRLVSNGTGGRYRIEGLADVDRTVEAHDLSGRWFPVPLISPDLIDLSRQPSGVYVLTVSSADASFKFKVVVGDR